MGDKFEINFDKNGFVTSLSEEVWSPGHSEGGFLTRESSKFPEELRRYIEIGSVGELKRLISIAVNGNDPVLRKVIGTLLLEMNLDAAPIIKETRQAQKAEAEARKKAEEKAKTEPHIEKRYLYNIDGGGGMHYILVSPDGVPLKDLGFVSDYKEKPTLTTIEKDGEEPGLR